MHGGDCFRADGPAEGHEQGQVACLVTPKALDLSLDDERQRTAC